jgi:hypothetical protein
MNGVPVAVPLAWSNRHLFFLLAGRSASRNGSDCLTQRRFLR